MLNVLLLILAPNVVGTELYSGCDEDFFHVFAVLAPQKLVSRERMQVTD